MNNAQGSILIQVLVLMGLIGLGALYSAQMAKSQAQLQMDNKLNLSFRMLSQTAEHLFKDNPSCTSNLFSFSTKALQDVGGGLETQTITLSALRIPAAGTSPMAMLLEVGKEPMTSPGVVISKIELSNFKEQIADQLYSATVRIEAQKGKIVNGVFTAAQSLGAPVIASLPFEMSLHTQMISGVRTVTSCGPPVSPPESIPMVGCWNRPHLPLIWSGADEDPCPGLNVMGATYVQDPALSKNMTAPPVQFCDTFTVKKKVGPITITSPPIPKYIRAVVCRKT